MSKFSIGQKVTWNSGGAGHSKQKTGTIIAIVPANVDPFRMDGKDYIIPGGRRIPYSRTRYGGGIPRYHVSYIVEVENPKGPHLATTYYWPLVSALRAVDGLEEDGMGGEG